MDVITAWRTEQERFTMEALYGYLGLTRQAIYQRQNRIRSKNKQEEKLLEQVKKVRERHRSMGSRVLYHKLEDAPIGITSFERMMSRRGMTIRNKSKRIVTTDSRGYKNYENLSNGLILNGINQLVVGDITYYKTATKQFYIFGLKDVYSSHIVGLVGDINMGGDKTMKCLNQLEKLRGREALSGLIHHTDGGGQYRSKKCLGWLDSRQIQISQAKNCLQNGSAEQLNHMIKNHYLSNYEINTVKELNRALKEIKYLMNHKRPVKELKYMTVIEYERYIQGIPMSERREVKCYDFDS